MGNIYCRYYEMIISSVGTDHYVARGFQYREIENAYEFRSSVGTKHIEIHSL